MIVKVGTFNIKGKERGYRRFKRTVPKKIAVSAKKHFSKAFHKGAMKGGEQTNKSRRGWEARKRETSSSRGKSILVDTGRMRNALEKRGVRKVSFRKTIISIRGVKYAYIHNDVGVMQKNPNRAVVREMLGHSSELNKKIKNIIIQDLNRALK